MKRLVLFILVTMTLGVFVAAFTRNNLRIFILGSWREEFPREEGSGERWAEYTFRFLPFNILVFDRISDVDDFSHIFSKYKFIDNDRVAIIGRLGDEMQVARVGNALMIDSVHGFPLDGTYTRISSIWGLLFWPFAVIVLGLLTFIRYRASRLSPAVPAGGLHR